MQYAAFVLRERPNGREESAIDHAVALRFSVVKVSVDPWWLFLQHWLHDSRQSLASSDSDACQRAWRPAYVDANAAC